MINDFTVESLENLTDTNSFNKWLAKAETKRELTTLQDRLIAAAGSGYNKARFTELKTSFRTQTKLFVGDQATIIDLENITFLVQYLTLCGFTIKEKKNSYEGFREFETEW